ncbi:MAG TPA: HAMP domain-containing sensor histidine kinase [Desulfomicrobiaceae bacterium]|nr:HAMP domain-containing sensor histidine kinase [Desulfomicrobiaceae bacterium]
MKSSPPFFNTKEVDKGTGQGLHISRQVITEMHGGKIEVETLPGQGTTFTITLPMGDKTGESGL